MVGPSRIEPSLDVDRALECAGGFGIFQRTVVILLAWPFLALGPLALLWVFVGMEPDRACTADSSHILPLQTKSAVVEWGLYCNHKSLVTLISSMFFFGFMLGATTLGWASDKLGRRVSFVIVATLVEISLVLCAVSQGPFLFAIGRALGGYGAGGLGLCSAVWSAELLGKHRSILLLSNNVAFALGMCLLSVLAWNLSSWRAQCWAIFFLGLPTFIAAHTLPESPKWLQTCGRNDAARKVIMYIAEVNRTPLPNFDELTSANDAQKSLRFTALFMAPLRSRTLVMAASWFVSSLCYYGLALDASAFGSNVYAVNALGALVELPAYVIIFMLVDAPRIGRKGLTVVCLFVAAMSSLCGTQFDEKTDRRLIVLVMIARFSVAAAFAVLHLWGAELFPTPLRAAALGVQSMQARIAGMSAPFVITYSKNPLMLFSLPLFLGAVLCSIMPETSGLKLPDTIDDVMAQETAAKELERLTSITNPRKKRNSPFSYI